MPNPVRLRYQRWRLEDLLRDQPGLRLQPILDGEVRLCGVLTFTAQSRGLERIEDTYELEISVPLAFPAELPAVRETAGRIPRDFHTHSDGQLCLGSPTRQRLALVNSPTLPTFVSKCIVPYLYGFSFREKHGTMPFGERAYGLSGVRRDFAHLFGVKTEAAAIEMVRLASLKKRIANKCPCPCGSKSRLGKCHNRKVNECRKLLGRPWFRGQYRWLTKQ